MTIGSVRRHRLLKRLVATELGYVELAAVWRAKQEATAGTALPATFPFASSLAAVGYSTVEDLSGATADELVTYAALALRDAETVIRALAAL